MGIIDRIKAGGTKSMEIGQRYTVTGIRIVESEDRYNPGQTRRQAVIDTPEGVSYYCPANITRACCESYDSNPDELADLIGAVIECQTYYSNRLRKDIKTGVIVDE